MSVTLVSPAGEAASKDDMRVDDTACLTAAR